MECLPWGVGPGGGSDPEGKRDPVPGVFFPGAQCEWTGPAPTDFPAHTNVLATPVVAMTLVSALLMVVVSRLTPGSRPGAGTMARYFAG